MYKGYRIVSLGTFAMFKIQNQSSGKVPGSLSGVFTNRELAEQAVDMYLNSLKKGVKSSGKKESIPSSN